MYVGLCVVEKGNAGSEQLLDGRDGAHGDHGAVGDDHVYPDPRPSVLADDAPVVDADAGIPVSVNLESGELPFQQPDPRTIPSGPDVGGWRAAVVDVGRWPLAGLALAAVLVAVFALFITRNGQSLTDDIESGAPQRAEVESEPLAAPAESDAGVGVGNDVDVGVDVDASGRSTGTLGPGEGSEFFSGQVVEPDRSLTGTDVDWTPTTVARRTTVTTATTPPSTVPPSTTAPPETTQPPETSQSTTTTPPSTTTSSPTTEAPEGNWVRAIGPGSGSEQNAVTVNGGRVTLEAEGSGEEFMLYRFVVSAKGDDGGWRQVNRSRWRTRPRWTINADRYEGQTLRWTVVGVTGFRDLTAESAPLYLRVADRNEDRSDDDSDDDDFDDDESDDDESDDD